VGRYQKGKTNLDVLSGMEGLLAVVGLEATTEGIRTEFTTPFISGFAKL